MKRIFCLLSSLAVVALCAATAFAGKLEDKVVVYSTHGESLLEVVADAFEAKTGVAVEFLNLKGELADRVRAEKANPQSDVMYGGPSSVYQELQAEDLFASFTPTWAAKVNPLFKDKDGYWIGTIQTPVLLFYNTEMLTAAEAPKDWKDLADPRYKDMLVFRNALSSSARATYSALLQQYEKKGELDKGWAFLKGVDANTKRYYGSGSLLFQAVGRKEAAISFSVLNDIIDNKTKNKMPLQFIDAASGSPVITDGIAVINNAKHPEAAKAFVEFAGSAEIQALLAQKFNRMPTLPDALAGAPEWMGQVTFKAMDVNWGELASRQSAWMQKWDAEIKDSAKDKK
ncbi:extracellular solute-binding protein family 1 [Pseudodesulfovibrio mercurii]|uniref:Extracellular solute-binding protein family 1 n=1 Tax=Pseudodesulfovibrio mercurii TaxID=641491 RepID=F0JJR7_9BACT|nr:extracellular solute-binding protein [Pseudodesulfovibrio mercurii]EGB16166.1 extracellular solute-binding protein family 1 [Pseudodesulfovibrio mercurii]